jgi:ABC-type dipeptide/oligopeptide/nickel transport system ATPase component
MSNANAILEVRDLHVEFRTRRGLARVINALDFSLEPGRTLGIVGESG